MDLILVIIEKLFSDVYVKHRYLLKHNVQFFSYIHISIEFCRTLTVFENLEFNSNLTMCSSLDGESSKSSVLVRRNIEGIREIHKILEQCLSKR